MTSKTKYFALSLIIAHLLSLVDSQCVQYCDMGRAVGDSSMVSELMVSNDTSLVQTCGEFNNVSSWASARLLVPT